ncbi:hypothetical protein RUND412_006560 [Rhizina undulata]
MYPSNCRFEPLLVLPFLALATATSVPRQYVTAEISVGAPVLSASVVVVVGRPNYTVVPLYSDAILSVVTAEVAHPTGGAGLYAAAGIGNIEVSSSIGVGDLQYVSKPSALNSSGEFALSSASVYAFSTARIMDIELPNVELTELPSLIRIPVLPTLESSAITTKSFNATWGAPTLSSYFSDATPCATHDHGASITHDVSTIHAASTTSRLVQIPSSASTPEVRPALSHTLKLSFKLASFPSSTPVSKTEFKFVFRPQPTASKISASTHASSSSSSAEKTTSATTHTSTTHTSTTHTSTTATKTEETTATSSSHSSSGNGSVRKNLGLELLLGLTGIAAIMAAL